MGLSVFGERPYRVRHPAGDAWIHDFQTRRSIGRKEVSTRVRSLFSDAFSRVWQGDIDDDGFNGLVLRAGLTWKEAMMFRAYSGYQHQIKVPYTQAYTIAVLNRHPEVVRKLNRLFRLRFRPGEAREETSSEQALIEFEALLDKVSSLDEDRILRGFLNLIQATLRTNFYRPEADGSEKTYVFGAHGGCTSARWPGGAWWSALVRPDGGLPHRDSRPDEGADGEEHRDRSGGFKGRFRGQGRDDPAARHARRHRQSGR
jgi:glutamate dehydrogenase